jgi:cytochrome c-type biogenesis protein CcmH
MMFWILVGLLSAVVLALFAWPLVRPRRTALGGEPDLAVYRDQLGELDREVARGLLPEAEAASARLEIQRRLLLAAAQGNLPVPEPHRGPHTLRAGAWALLLVLLPAAAVAIYLDLGTPGLPSIPFASRPPAAARDQELAKLVDSLSAKMKANPSDPEGWSLLAASQAKLGRFKESIEAYAQAISRSQAPGAELQSRYGEVLTLAADGQVTPRALAAFAATLALDPKEPRARFYTALAESQAGHLEAALTQWVALEADSPADAPWRDTLAAQIESTAKQLGRDPATLPGRNPAPAAPPPSAGSGAGPTPEDMTKAANMTPEQRAAFIDSMVSGLASRLKTQPDDIDGWLRLANAYDKLGRAEEASAAWREAANRGPDRLDAQLAYASAMAPIADQGPLPADFAATVARIRKLSPDDGLGLYCAGLVARANGDKAGARALWQKVLPLTPEGSPQRKDLEAKIAALGP